MPQIFPRACPNPMAVLISPLGKRGGHRLRERRSRPQGISPDQRSTVLTISPTHMICDGFIGRAIGRAHPMEPCPPSRQSVGQLHPVKGQRRQMPLAQARRLSPFSPAWATSLPVGSKALRCAAARLNRHSATELGQRAFKRSGGSVSSASIVIILCHPTSSSLSLSGFERHRKAAFSPSPAAVLRAVSPPASAEALLGSAHKAWA